MKQTTYALIAGAALAAATTVPATAQQVIQAPVGTTFVIITSLSPVVLRLSVPTRAGRHEQTHRVHQINIKPVKLEPVNIVASRDGPSSHNK
jgi:hypothetical protein